MPNTYQYRSTVLKKIRTRGYEAAMSAIRNQVDVFNLPKTAMFQVQGNLLQNVVNEVVAQFERDRTRKKGYATSYKTLEVTFSNPNTVHFRFHAEDEPFCTIFSVLM